MVLNFLRENQGKSLLIVGIILVWVILGVLFKTYGYSETWELWNVPTLQPVFLDFRLIPGSAESFRRGFEPMVENPFDPEQRTFNYPAFWRLFFYTKISMDDTIWIVILLLVLYFACIILFPQKISVVGAVLMLLVVFSPASMLLYERGNADLFVFIICVMIVLVAGYSANLALILIMFGTAVKLFPFFGLTVLLGESRQKFFRLILGGVLFFGTYGLLTIESQEAAWNTTMRGKSISYGSFVLFTRLGYFFQELFPDFLSLLGWKIFFEGMALLLILIAGIVAICQPHSLVAQHKRNLSAFRMGASIYLGTFLLGNNWDYRLAFLVLVIPQLVEWMFTGNKKYSWISYTVTALLLLTVWSFVIKIDLPFIPLDTPINRRFIVDEFINWLLVPGFSYLLAASFPEWLKVDLQKIIGKSRLKFVGR